MQAELSPEFEVLRVLGEGSMATVYLAREPALERLVAIKVLHSDVSDDPTARRRFEREARSAARLSHPNIVGVYRVAALEGGQPYQVMEYVPGRNLEDVIAAGGLPRSDACRALSQVASALATAHREAVVHRDVRLANIMWDDDAKRAVLTDFGIAGVLESGAEVVTRLTAVGEVLGNPRFMSPEQLVGQTVTGATDLYGLGVVGYLLLVGQEPFDVKGAVALANAHLHQDPRPVASLDPTVDPALASILERCLARKPDQRPSADAVAAAFDPDRGGRGVPADGGASMRLAESGGEIPLLRDFIRELRRRRVFNVAAVYGALAFALLEGSELLLPALPLPSWTYSAVVAVTLAGFPVALVIGWIFDITSEGIQKSSDSSAAGGRHRLRVLQGVGLGLSLTVAALIGWWILT